MITARLGNTVYELEETNNPARVVKLTRTNFNGDVTHFYVPVSLLTDYLAERVLPDLLKKAIER